MKTLLTIAVAVVLFSCGKNSDSDKNDLLTTVAWTVEKGSIDGNMPKATETSRFLNDGTYSLESGETKVNGKWNWTNDGEIYLQMEGITIKGQANQFDSPSNYYIKIVELTDKNLLTLERGESDAWDSGFAKNRSYTAVSL